MITRVTIRNLKRFKEQTFEGLQGLHLLVGQNNSGKSTLLHALAIWNYCVEEFRVSERTGTKAIEITLANFTPLPLSDFKLLWHEKTERSYPETGELDPRTNKPKKKQEFIAVEIEVVWNSSNGGEKRFTVLLRWHNRNTVYASPKGGWEEFRQLDANGNLAQSSFPKMVYVPPSSNIAALERPLDMANLRALVGEGRPGSVVRNMIWLTFKAEGERNPSRRFAHPFSLLQKHIGDWFGVTVNDPEYMEGRSRFVVSTYTTAHGKLELDWVNAGSGLLQCLIVLTFLYGFQPDVLLLDEPDAHLHVNLQRTLLDFLKRQKATQMLIATHAEEFIQRVHPDQICFLTLSGVKRVPDTEVARLALSEISNLDISNLIARKVFVYVEGETYEELFRGWAKALLGDAELKSVVQNMDRVAFVPLRGGSADEMLQFADRHFRGCKLIGEGAERVMVLDRNDGKWVRRAEHDPKLFIWRKRHIENYLLVPSAWERAARTAADSQFPIASVAAATTVTEFFAAQSRGLTVDWLNPTEQIFRDVDAKLMLFEARKAREDGYDALTARLHQQSVVVSRGDIASVMSPSEIHDDIKQVFRLIGDALSRQSV